MYEGMHVVRRDEKEARNYHCSHDMPQVFMRIAIRMCQDGPNPPHLEGSQQWAATLLV